MTQKDGTNAKYRPSKQHVLIALALLSVVYVCGLLVSKTIYDEKRFSKSEILEFKSFSALNEIKISLKNRHGVYDLQIEDGVGLLPPQAVANFSVPYILQAKWQDKKGEYRDVVWTLDKRGVGYNIALDGFEDGQTVSLIVNDDTPIKNTSFDWSGRIEFPVLLHDDKDFSVCVDIHGPHDGKICHRILGKKSGDA